MRATPGGVLGRIPTPTPALAVALLAAMLGAVVALGLAAPAASAETFSNNNGITINDGRNICITADPATVAGSANPYPSEISVSGLGSSLTDVNVTISGPSDPVPEEIGLLLVSPAGKSTILMTDSGGLGGANGITLTFDDAASSPVPWNLDVTQPLPGGTYLPTQGTWTIGEGCPAPVSFPAPAPEGPYSSPSLSVFNGTNPNGIWKLYVIDDSFEHTGSIAGWSLDIGPPSVTVNQASGQADPTSTSPIHFTAVFSEAVTGFTASDVTLSGTAAGPTKAVVSGGPKTFDIAVSGMSSGGTVIASIPANAAQDTSLDGNTASTGTDNTVTFIDNSPPETGRIPRRP